ncbi:molybdopterin-dependent oxidoreductase [Consotaella aegiceratis]|uniref:molybdopterin-dependent oxidoreductase n=1 Tax=Consotaella aegiceratis TaxID=3097961 RepID=UPI002F402C89
MPPTRILTASHWGVYHALVEDGRMVGVEPFEKDQDPSPIIHAMPQALTAPSRVLAPAVREGWLRDGAGSDRSGRGRERFVTVSWKTALDLVAGEIARVREDYGNESLYGGSYGWSSAGRFHHAKSQVGRFLNACGGATKSRDTYSVGAGSVILPHVLGSDRPIWGPVTGWDVLAANAELIVCFGGLPLKNAQIEAGGVGNHKVRGFLERMAARGGAFVLVSPMQDDLPAFTQAHWIRPMPNTDVALMLGLAHVLYREGLYDADFVARYTVGFEAFLTYLLGTRDGIAKTPEWAAAICAIEAEEIVALARRMARHRTFINLSLSVQRCDHGEQTYWMGAVLAAMLGQIGLPGGGIGYGYAAVHGTGNPVPRFRPPTLPLGVDPLGRFIPVARVADMLDHPGATIDYDGQRITYPDVRLIYWCGGNPLHHHQDLNHFLKALRKPETIVVHEPWWTPFARFADIVLPATTTAERDDIMSSRADGTILAMKQAVPPVAGARNDHTIFTGIARRIGKAEAEAFTEGRSEAEWLRHIYEISREQSAAMGVDLPEFDAFWEAGLVELPERTEPFEMYADFRADLSGHPLGTPSGRIEIFSERIASFGYDDCIGHPAWFEPWEWHRAPLAQVYPLHLVSNQPAARLHSQLDMGPVSQATKIKGREPVYLNPQDAATRGIADGDVVRLFNDRGATLAGARLSDRLRPGVVLMATGAWYDPEDPARDGSMDKTGNPNVLTLDKGTSKLAQATAAQTALVEVEKWAGPLPPVTAYDPPVLIDEGELE